MALSKIDAANFLNGTIPSGNITTASLAAAATGKVLNVVSSSVTTSTIESTSTTPVEISSSMRVTITPASTSSKFLIQFFATVKSVAGENMAYAIYKSVGGAGYAKTNAGSSTEAFRQRNSTHDQVSTTMQCFDAPNTTSQVIYTPYFWCPSTGSVMINDNGMGSFLLVTEYSS